MIEVREANNSDLKPVALLYIESFPTALHSRLGPISCVRFLKAVYMNPSYTLLIGTQFSQIVGFAVLHVDRTKQLKKTWILQCWREIIIKPTICLQYVHRTLRFAGNYFSRYLPSFVKNNLVTRTENGIIVRRDGIMSASCYLDFIGVSSELRCCGMGTALIEACKQQVVATGNKQLMLHVKSTHKQATRLYERTGFVVVETNKYRGVSYYCWDIQHEHETMNQGNK